MIYIVLGIVIGLLVWGVYNIIYHTGGIIDLISNILLGGVSGFAIWLTIGSLIGIFLPTTDIVTEEQEIYALNDSSTIKGKNFLFSGYIDEKFVCRYIVNTDKGKSIEEIDTDDNKFYIEEGNYKPKVVKYSIGFKSNWHYLFAFPMFHDYYKFFVPEGTVTNTYNIDLQ